ncbi:unnamed protein product [Bemisia tabaci]|uniref:AAA-ATPase-like domain-containing protein n=2 Tax=Bemisia tabaci TaxID=7038 RepID=A0A9P0G0T8_BEMTA|nr:unnamed protein product [Bemisia tabaci]
MSRFLIFYLCSMPLALNGFIPTVQEGGFTSDPQHLAAPPYTGNDFKEMVELRVPLVDKTDFIKQFNSSTKRILITRPRGFGKTFNLSMLKHFYALNTNSSHLFQDKAICKDKTFCAKYLNKREVLYMSFGGLNHSTFEGVRGAFKGFARRLYQENSYLANSSHVPPAEQPAFKAFARGKINDNQIPEAFGLLVRYLHAGRGKLVLLLDDYDGPIRTGYTHKYYDRIRTLVTAILRALFQDDYLEFGVVTGITNVGTEDMNFLEYPMNDGALSEFFGFTYDEMESLAKQFGEPKPGLVPKMEAMYEGYYFGNRTVHNPYDVVVSLRRGGDLDDHWVQACGDENPYEFWNEFGLMPSLKGQFLLGDVMPRQWLRKQVDLSLMDSDEDMFWTYVTRLGYLTVADVLSITGNGDALYALRIPNQELRETIHFIVYGIPHHFQVREYEKFEEAYQWQQEKAATRILTKYANRTGKYFKTAPLRTALGLVTGLEETRGRLIKVPGDCEMYIFEKAQNMILLRTVIDKADLNPQTEEKWMIDCFEHIKKKLPENRVTRQAVVSVWGTTVIMQFYQYR